MPHDPVVSVLDMIGAVERAQRSVEGLTEDEFVSDEHTQWAIFSQIVFLGEVADRIDSDFQALHGAIPWSKAIGMRHRLAHGYDSVGVASGLENHQGRSPAPA